MQVKINHYSSLSCRFENLTPSINNVPLFFFLGNLKHHCSAVASQAANTCAMLCLYSMKIVAFLAFHSCQHDKAMKAENSSGTPFGGGVLCMLLTLVPTMAVVPSFS
ncbi:hypothetical protein BDA96_01G139000 [Sorghum bicolor]|uniref:Uncharacterized protein n=2 Tax=Sorghum bicolor TaxID=4558 RepID=A0A1Z5S5H8_SORBI|nr:hypothetical protein BDA96_01G139000 [Sorghum bicolor]OQU91181.1 hypothetical protein SORBI_3001G133532 [Sorghum bicolor]